MSGLRLIEAAPTALEAALAHEIVAAKADDPLAPVGVLIGGTLLRPYLGRRLAELCNGIVNVRFLTPSDLALALGERAMLATGARPLPPLGDRVVAREAAAEHDGYFAPVRDTPGFGDALHHLFRELRGAGYDAASFASAVENRCEADGKDAALADLFERFLTRRAGFYSPDDCLLSAEVEHPPWKALAVYGLWDPSAAIRDCLERLAHVIPVTVYSPRAGGNADAATAGLRAWAIAADAEVHEPDEAPETDGGGLGGLRRRLFTPADTPTAARRQRVSDLRARSLTRGPRGGT